MPSLAQTATPATPAAAPAAAPAAQAAPAPTVIDVKLSEWTMGMSALKAKGPVQFNIENVGQFPHVFKIDVEIGGKMVEISSARLLKGEKTSMTLLLPPGTYHVDCPVGNHESRGMMAELVIE